MAGEIKLNKIYNIDCLDGLKKILDNSIDLIVTDPPYGISFMQRQWDKAIPSIDIWKECLRVLKHGAFAFIFCIPRQDCLSRMIISLEDAGFNTGFTSIYWTFSQGFPKSCNIGKMVDKRAGRIVTSVITLKERLIELFNTSGKTRSQIDEECGFRACNYLTLPKEGKRPDPWVNILPSQKKWKIIKNVLGCDEDIEEELDSFFAEAEREILGTISKARAKGQKSPLPTLGAETEYIDINITIPSSPQAKALDGSYAGFQPKPSVEIILVVMRPLSEKSYVDQALKNKHGISWLDDCRIPYENDDDKLYGQSERKTKANITGLEGGFKEFDRSNRKNIQGRFPSHLLVSNDVLNDGKNWNRGGSVPNKGKQHNLVYGKYAERPTWEAYNDSGSFSRYFSLDAWWNDKIKKLPESVQKTFPFLITPKPSKSEKDKGLEYLDESDVKFFKTHGGSGKPSSISKTYPDGKPRLPTKMKNIHPTIKSIELMSYLITLGTREKDIVLDPFVGSGTTCIAAKMLSRKFIGMDINSEYVDIAKNRLKIISNINEWI